MLTKEQAEALRVGDTIWALVHPESVGPSGEPWVLYGVAVPLRPQEFRIEAVLPGGWLILYPVKPSTNPVADVAGPRVVRRKHLNWGDGDGYYPTDEWHVDESSALAGLRRNLAVCEEQAVMRVRGARAGVRAAEGRRRVALEELVEARRALLAVQDYCLGAPDVSRAQSTSVEELQALPPEKGGDEE